MTRYVALLRGVNVGGKNKVPMSELRNLFESLGYSEVSTFIQSGNILFTSGVPATSTRLETAISDQFRISISVVLRTPQRLKTVVDRNPFNQVDSSKLHIGFMTEEPSAATVRMLDTRRFQPEEFAVRGSELYLHLPNGMGRAKLPAYLDRQLKVPTTIRTWNTVVKLLELADG